MRSFFRCLTAICLLAALPAGAETGSWNVTTSGTLNSLGVISIYSYGTTRYAKQIGQWNGIRPPYRLKLGQTLALKRQPTLNAADGEAAVAQMWRGRAAVQEIASKTKPQAEPRDLFDRAVQASSPDETLALLRRNRKRDPGHLPTWFQELRILKTLGRTQEVAKVAEELVATNPNVAQVPAVKRYRNEAAQ